MLNLITTTVRVGIRHAASRERRDCRCSSLGFRQSFGASGPRFHCKHMHNFFCLVHYNLRLVAGCIGVIYIATTLQVMTVHIVISPCVTSTTYPLALRLIRVPSHPSVGTIEKSGTSEPSTECRDLHSPSPRAKTSLGTPFAIIVFCTNIDAECVGTRKLEVTGQQKMTLQ